MATVRYATLCEMCGRRSDEYTEWPECRDCSMHLCPTCAVPGSSQEEDRTTGGGEAGPEVSYEVTTVLCADCARNHPDPNGYLREPESEAERLGDA
jgi:hypothetical protein